MLVIVFSLYHLPDFNNYTFINHKVNYCLLLLTY